MISEEEVRHVAELARLGLTDEEIKRAGEQLGVILNAVEAIRELDLEGVPPTAKPPKPDQRLQGRRAGRGVDSGRGALPGPGDPRRLLRRPEDRLGLRGTPRRLTRHWLRAASLSAEDATDTRSDGRGESNEVVKRRRET